MDEQKFEYLVGELEDDVEFNKLYNYKKFRQLVKDTLTYKLTKAETIELKNHFNWIVRDQRELHKKRFKELKEHYLCGCAFDCNTISKEQKEILYYQAWQSI